MNIAKHIRDEKQIKQILKDKSSTYEQKCEKVIDLFKKYFTENLEVDAKFLVFENHYDGLRGSNKVVFDANEFKKFYQMEREEILLDKCYKLTKVFEYFLNQQFYVNNMPEDYRECFREAMKMTCDCNFDSYKNLSVFFEDQKVHDKLLAPMNKFVEYISNKTFKKEEEKLL